MRPDLDHWMIELASVVAKRSTCLRRAVGCILVDARGHVLSTGYNGVAAGMAHCNEEDVNYSFGCMPGVVRPLPTGQYPHACSGAKSPSGQNLDGCQAIHAEQNALLQCRDVDMIHSCYVTTSPCLTCTKLLMNTSCSRILFTELYAQSSSSLWLSSRNSREWTKI